MDKKQVRLRRARKTRAKIAELKAVRLTVFRSNCHIYAQVISGCGSRVLAAASTVEPEVRAQVPNGGNKQAAEVVGKLIAERAKAAGIEQVAFDRWVSCITVASRRWPRLPAKAVSSSKRGFEWLSSKPSARRPPRSVMTVCGRRWSRSTA